MKKKILFLAFIMAGMQSVHSQTDSTNLPPYKKFPFFPQISLRLPDSTSFFTREDLPKKKQVLLMLFNPECSHCQHETEELVKDIDKFKDIEILMVTSMQFDSMLSFRAKYQLDKYDNIVMAHDDNFFLITYFQIRNLPFLAFFNKKRELIDVFEGGLPMDLILEKFDKKD